MKNIIKKSIKANFLILQLTIIFVFICMKEKKCSSCEQKGVSKNQYLLILLGFWIMFSSTYGTVKLFELLVNSFK